MAPAGVTGGRSPGDWPTVAERRYAEWQARLAEHYDLAVESRVLDTDAAGRVHYLAAGDPDGEPVVLLHGITAPAAYWLPLVPALADEYRVYAPDMPGEGLSAKPDYRDRTLRPFATAYLRELVTDLGLGRPHVVGHSLGGLQAFLLAIDHGLVDRLCLPGAPAGLSRDFPLLVRLFTVKGLGRALLWASTRGDPVESARAWMRQFSVVDDAAVPEVFYELYATRSDLPGLEASLASLFDVAGTAGRMHPLTDVSDEVLGIERPTCFLWGSEDYYWAPDVGRPVAERMPGATFHELPGLGHAPWLEPGDAAASRVRSFLDG